MDSTTCGLDFLGVDKKKKAPETTPPFADAPAPASSEPAKADEGSSTYLWVLGGLGLLAVGGYLLRSDRLTPKKLAARRWASERAAAGVAKAAERAAKLAEAAERQVKFSRGAETIYRRQQGRKMREQAEAMLAEAQRLEA